MTKNQSLIFRSLLFLAGAGIILLAFFLTTSGKEPDKPDVFMWISIGVMYLVLSLPFFFSAIDIANLSGKVPKLSIVWTGIIVYVITSIIIIVVLKMSVFNLNAAIIIQAIIFFVFLINVYLACFASSHVGKVAAEEAGMQRYIVQLKPKAQSLLLAVNRLPPEYEKAQKKLRQAIEDIKYIYPINSGAGDELEQEIIQSLNVISEYCGNIQAGGHTAALEDQAESLTMLVKERKLLRN
jgi:hypothetical protein